MYDICKHQTIWYEANLDDEHDTEILLAHKMNSN